MPRASLGRGPWHLEPPDVIRLLEKIRAAGVPLAEYAGVKPYRGVVTGLNEAFLIDTPTRDALVREDPKSAEILKPYLRGQDIERWHPDWAGLWMIFSRRGIDITVYPAVLRHLDSFRQQLEPKPADWSPSKPGEQWPGRKPGSYKWFEIQDSIYYYDLFSKPKIYYQEIQFHPDFPLDERGLFGNNKTFFVPVEDLYLLSGNCSGPLRVATAWA